MQIDRVAAEWSTKDYVKFHCAWICELIYNSFPIQSGRLELGGV